MTSCRSGSGCCCQFQVKWTNVGFISQDFLGGYARYIHFSMDERLWIDKHMNSTNDDDVFLMFRVALRWSSHLGAGFEYHISGALNYNVSRIRESNFRWHPWTKEALLFFTLFCFFVSLGWGFHFFRYTLQYSNLYSWHKNEEKGVVCMNAMLVSGKEAWPCNVFFRCMVHIPAEVLNNIRMIWRSFWNHYILNDRYPGIHSTTLE